LGIQWGIGVGALDLQEWQQHDRCHGQREQDRPRPPVHGVQHAGESVRTVRGRFAVRHEHREPRGDEPVLRRPQDEEDERRTSVERHDDHARKSHDVESARQ
jgi:hypothetical protein